MVIFSIRVLFTLFNGRPQAENAFFSDSVAGVWDFCSSVEEAFEVVGGGCKDTFDSGFLESAHPETSETAGSKYFCKRVQGDCVKDWLVC